MEHYLKKELYDLIKKDESIFDLLHMNTLDGIWYWDLENTDHEWISPKYWVELGYNPSEMPHTVKAWQNVVFPEDLKIAEEKIQEHLKDPSKPFDQLIRHKHKDGSTVYLRCRGIAIFDSNKKPIRMLGSHTNYTKVKELENKWQSSVENMRDGFQVIDKNYNYVYLNKTTERLSKFPPGALIGKNMLDMFPGIENMDVFKMIKDVMENRESKSQISDFTYEDGTVVTHKNTVEPFDDGVCIYTSEIPEIVKQNAVLERKNKDLEEFTYIASHDLQEPLNSIISVATILERYKGQLDTTGQKSLEIMVSSANRMKDFIRALLEYSTIGKETEKTAVDIHQLVEHLKVDLQSLITETGAKIEYHGQKLEVMGLESYLMKLFQNLVVNGIKYNDGSRKPVVVITGEEKDTEYLFSIKDNGIGIDPQHYKKIFDIFQRLHPRNHFSGTGIGLSHCKKIVELHKGKIWLESELAKGSTFFFTIAKA